MKNIMINNNNRANLCKMLPGLMAHIDPGNHKS